MSFDPVDFRTDGKLGTPSFTSTSIVMFSFLLLLFFPDKQLICVEKISRPWLLIRCWVEERKYRRRILFAAKENLWDQGTCLLAGLESLANFDKSLGTAKTRDEIN